mmetsp:Transcript_4920/g.15119  ORF Transcript_4920/g.15119 Transcript_4920/m.15119 type:complete len:209 (+) Transcript_4920:195-821(+)
MCDRASVERFRVCESRSANPHITKRRGRAWRVGLRWAWGTPLNANTGSSLLLALLLHLLVVLALQLATRHQVLEKAWVVVLRILVAAAVEELAAGVEVEIVRLQLKLQRSPCLRLRFLEVGLLQVTQHGRARAHGHHLHQPVKRDLGLRLLGLLRRLGLFRLEHVEHGARCGARREGHEGGTRHCGRSGRRRGLECGGGGRDGQEAFQ